jgi:hypothetical protein
MKYSFGDVTVYNPDGTGKKVVKAEKLSKKMWKEMNKEYGGFTRIAGGRKYPVDPEDLDEVESY